MSSVGQKRVSEFFRLPVACKSKKKRQGTSKLSVPCTYFFIGHASSVSYDPFGRVYRDILPPFLKELPLVRFMIGSIISSTDAAPRQPLGGRVTGRNQERREYVSTYISTYLKVHIIPSTLS